MLALIPVVLIIGLALGWKVHARFSRHYKQLWLQAVAQLQDRSLFAESDPGSAPGPPPPPIPGVGGITPLVGRQALPPTPVSPQYVHGKWALDEEHDGSTAIYRAIRLGFDPVTLGSTAQYARFKALYRRDKEQAQATVDEMNENPLWQR